MDELVSDHAHRNAEAIEESAIFVSEGEMSPVPERVDVLSPVVDACAYRRVRLVVAAFGVGAIEQAIGGPGPPVDLVGGASPVSGSSSEQTISPGNSSQFSTARVDSGGSSGVIRVECGALRGDTLGPRTLSWGTRRHFGARRVARNLGGQSGGRFARELNFLVESRCHPRTDVSLICTRPQYGPCPRHGRHCAARRGGERPREPFR